MRRLALIAAASALLIAPSSAEAKGLKWVEVCGLDACSKASGKNWNFERRPLIFPPTVMSGRPDDAPETPAPWYRVTVAFSHANGHKARSTVAPDIRYAGGRDGSYGYVWQKLRRKELRTYLDLSEGLAPYPAESMPGGAERTTNAMASALQSTAAAVSVVLRRA
jgi:hypothetical protein